MKNKYSIFKRLLKTSYTSFAKRFFNLVEPLIAHGFTTGLRRKYVYIKTKILNNFLNLILRSVTKEFSDTTADFINRLRSLGLWQFSNFEPDLLKANSTLAYYKKKENFLIQESGLAGVSSINSINKNIFAKFTELPYLD